MIASRGSSNRVSTTLVAWRGSSVREAQSRDGFHERKETLVVGGRRKGETTREIDGEASRDRTMEAAERKGWRWEKKGWIGGGNG